MGLFFNVISELVLAIALPYFLFSTALGLWVARRSGKGLRAHELVSGFDGGANRYHVYFLVACLNEELVIGSTVRHLLSETSGHVLVIDDGSDDETAVAARRAATDIGAGERLDVLERKLPAARLGKGPALNAAFAWLLDDVHQRRLDPAEVIVVVMDADGHLSAGASQAALQHFDVPGIGGVQMIVRIRNRDKLIGQFQDVEFWMISALSQFARSQTGTVSLGGNGQFTRLSALLELRGDPWSSSLTEDLDLGLRLLAAGWKVTTTDQGFVDQQGVDTYRRLLKQRTRWYQGHLACITRLPELWRSERIGQTALAEVSAYLLVPWLIVLPWSVLQQWVFFELVTAGGNGIFVHGLQSGVPLVIYWIVFYLFSFMPNLLIGVIYARRTKAVSLGRALLLGHLMIVWNYIGYVAVWRGMYRMARGRNGWDKTTRNVEEGADCAGVSGSHQLTRSTVESADKREAAATYNAAAGRSRPRADERSAWQRRSSTVLPVES